MCAHRFIPNVLSRAGTASALTVAAVGGTLLAPSAAAAAPHEMSHGALALRIAATKKGVPYKWGGTGPSGFDCSGLVQYSYRRAGKKLPRTAAAQYHRTRKIARAERKRGDLVFFHSGRNVYHVGIYAGRGKVLHAPRTGAVVRLETIWTNSVWYGRVR